MASVEHQTVLMYVNAENFYKTCTVDMCAFQHGNSSWNLKVYQTGRELRVFLTWDFWNSSIHTALLFNKDSVRASYYYTEMNKKTEGKKIKLPKRGGVYIYLI